MSLTDLTHTDTQMINVAEVLLLQELDVMLKQLIDIVGKKA